MESEEDAEGDGVTDLAAPDDAQSEDTADHPAAVGTGAVVPIPDHHRRREYKRPALSKCNWLKLNASGSATAAGQLR